jgi:hypothetical protein
MKSTERFKEVMRKYLDDRASTDELFAVTYKKEGKNIDDCITYILNTVKDSGCNGFTDEEVFSMAVHYYDENDIKAGSTVDCEVVMNHKVQLTEEEIAEAKKQAIEQVKENAIKEMRKKQFTPKKEIVQTKTLDLFNETTDEAPSSDR